MHARKQRPGGFTDHSVSHPSRDDAEEPAHETPDDPKDAMAHLLLLCGSEHCLELVHREAERVYLARHGVSV